MTRTAMALLVASGALLLSGAAQAKAPPSGMDVCGVSTCIHLASQDAEQFWTRAGGPGRPTAPAPFYVLRWHFDAEPEQSAAYVPATGAIVWQRGAGRWGALSAEGGAAMRRSLAAVEPYPAPTLTRVTVGRRVAREPQTYLRLYDGRPTPIFPPTEWVTVTLRSAADSPWTNGALPVRLGKTAPYVLVDGWTFRIPRALARRARRGLPLGG